MFLSDTLIRCPWIIHRFRPRPTAPRGDAGAGCDWRAARALPATHRTRDRRKQDSRGAVACRCSATIPVPALRLVAIAALLSPLLHCFPVNDRSRPLGRCQALPLLAGRRRELACACVPTARHQHRALHLVIAGPWSHKHRSSSASARESSGCLCIPSVGANEPRSECVGPRNSSAKAKPAQVRTCPELHTSECCLSNLIHTPSPPNNDCLPSPDPLPSKPSCTLGARLDPPHHSTSTACSAKCLRARDRRSKAWRPICRPFPPRRMSQLRKCHVSLPTWTSGAASCGHHAHLHP